MIKMDGENLRKMREFGVENYHMHIGPQMKNLLEAGYAQTQKAINENLYGSMWDIKSKKPKPWLTRQISHARHWIAEHIVDLAEFIGGYDVRGDW